MSVNRDQGGRPKIDKPTGRPSILPIGNVMLGSVDRSIQLSNQFIKDFKEIADLTYLIPVFEGEETSESFKGA